MDKVDLNYGVKDIKTLEGIEAIRLRPGMYIGSTGPEGVKQITLEIISNAVDEYLNGYCTRCSIYVGAEDNITIIDNGRGIPFGKAKDGSETLENIFTKLHTGAKFDSSGKTGYNTSGGMNGVGAKATNALSYFFNVSSHRDGKEAILMFKQGKKISDIIIRDWTNKDFPSGTKIDFMPDEEIFKEGITLDYKDLKNTLQELAYLSPGLVFHLQYKDKNPEDITSNRGILDYIDDLNKNKEVITSVFSAETSEDRIGVKIAMSYNSTYSDTYKLYTNSIPNTGGTHLTGFRTALTQQINEYARDNKLLKEKDSNITGDELKEGLTLVLSFIMPDPVFSGQTKEVLSSSEARTIVQRLVAKELKIWLDSHPKDAKAIIEKALLARAAREKAKKAKETVRKQDIKKRTVLPGTLADASSKNRSECEVFIVEGKSAAGSTKEARDRATQAVLPVRGKILNVLKADLHKAMQNAEISSMIDAFGLEVKDGKVIVDESKLRYGKIIITADADVDGSHIRILFLTFIWKFAPELIERGYIYAAVPPLYRATTGTSFRYIKDDRELEEFRKTYKRNFELNRMKGLGEMDPHEMAETVMNPETRTLKQIQMEDITEVAKTFMGLMGEAVSPRKTFIEQNAWRANVDI
ncbi:MAG: DNA topoisomerase IV subunit B [Bacillota bacterium]|nr:DNA topoisomerase IV subunit B [Bacillota bacterium]